MTTRTSVLLNVRVMFVPELVFLAPVFFSISSNAGIDEKYIVDVGMVDVRYLKQFHAHWDEDSELGRTLHAAQQQCFVNEGCGVPIREDFANELMGKPGNSHPVLGENTTESEFEEALFVRGCDTCTRFDLEMNRLNENEPGWDDDFILNDLKEGKNMTPPYCLVLESHIKMVSMQVQMRV